MAPVTNGLGKISIRIGPNCQSETAAAKMQKVQKKQLL